jgi:hypothetical protein
MGGSAMSNFKSKGASSDPSKFDQFFGKHFQSLVVGILIVILIICFTVYIHHHTVDSNQVITFFSSAIIGLIGFFAGSAIKKDN